MHTDFLDIDELVLGNGRTDGAIVYWRLVDHFVQLDYITSIYKALQGLILLLYCCCQ